MKNIFVLISNKQKKSEPELIIEASTQYTAYVIMGAYELYCFDALQTNVAHTSVGIDDAFLYKCIIY